jgi:predicted nuclease of restriction endonuclease-like (RecB) superfamily
MAAKLVLPPDYETFLSDLKAKVQAARVRAALQANSELIKLYWELGNKILEQQKDAFWGDKLLEQIAGDLRRAFPDMKGFSARNLQYMRAFAQAYPDQIVQRPVAQLPWGQNITIISKLKDPQTRDWYAQACFEYGWSRPILEMQIENNLHQRTGKAINNFKQTLPPPQSDLATQILKDPYIFDFLSVGETALEREIERGLLAHLKEFLLELGVGFALVGSQYHLALQDEDVYIDLLFYHLKLRAFVVIELKAREVQPADVAQVMAYVGIVDEKLRHSTDAPTVGLVLGKGKKVMAEYVLRNINAPIGIAEYITAEALPKNLEADLPTIAQLEAELERLEVRDD